MHRRYGQRLAAVAGLSASLASWGYGGAAEAAAEQPKPHAEELAPEFQQLLTDPEFQGGEAVTEWNELVVTTAYEVDEWFSLLGHRTLTMMHLAMHDALNAIVPVYEPYAYRETGVAAHPVVAVSQAARDVAAAAYPDHEDRFDELHDRWLSKAPEDERTTRGVELGGAAASAIMERRAEDNFDAEGEPYAPGDQPGDYRFTEPFDFAFGVALSEAKPFGMTSADQFRSGAPPALGSDDYAAALNEVRALGARNSEERTSDQTHIAHWWAEFCESWCSRLGRKLVEEHDLHLWKTARLFALFHMDNFDGYVSNFEAKYHYNFWRPVTAIRQADADGNPNTEADPEWLPEMETLPFPDYPSAHAQACQGAAQVFADVFGTSELSFTMDSLTAPEEGPGTRSYDNLEDAAENCGLSRIYNGFHFRFAVDAGAEQGRERAKFLLDNYLQRRSAADHPDLATF